MRAEAGAVCPCALDCVVSRAATRADAQLSTRVRGGSFLWPC